MESNNIIKIVKDRSDYSELCDTMNRKYAGISPRVLNSEQRNFLCNTIRKFDYYLTSQQLLSAGYALHRNYYFPAQILYLNQISDVMRKIRRNHY